MNKTLVIALIASALVHGLLFLLPGTKGNPERQKEYISYTVTLAAQKPEKDSAPQKPEPIPTTENTGVRNEKPAEEARPENVTPAAEQPAPESEGSETHSAAEAGGDDLQRERAEYNRLLSEVRSRIKDSLVYPRIAKRKNMEGLVGLSFVLSETGKIEKVEVHESSGYAVLDRAALELMERISPLEVFPESDTAIRINIVYDLQSR
jgi:periplasmic protein TonB